MTSIFHFKYHYKVALLRSLTDAVLKKFYKVSILLGDEETEYLKVLADAKDVNKEDQLQYKQFLVFARFVKRACSKFLHFQNLFKRTLLNGH
jgi:hypothetical protein